MTRPCHVRRSFRAFFRVPVKPATVREDVTHGDQRIRTQSLLKPSFSILYNKSRSTYTNVRPTSPIYREVGRTCAKTQPKAVCVIRERMRTRRVVRAPGVPEANDWEAHKG